MRRTAESGNRIDSHRTGIAMDKTTYRIEITCGKCRKKFEQEVVGHDHANAICPNCGYHVFTVPLTLRAFRQAIEKAELELETKDLADRLRQGAPK